MDTGNPADKYRCQKCKVDTEEQSTHQHADRQDPYHADFRNLGLAGSGVDVHKCTLVTCDLCGHGGGGEGGRGFRAGGSFRGCSGAT